MQGATRGMLRATSLSASLLAAPLAAQVQVPAEAAAASPAPNGSEGGDIVVTGSRIVRPDLTVASPVNVIGTDEIRYRQPITAEDLLRDLPSVRPAFGPAVNNGGDGSAQVDLRGLGTNRTLVLIDGKRIVPFGLDGLVDLNTVPTALLERVDVVTGGASSVYGADAVAGVVNFVTRRDFQGVDLSANYRITDKGDARQYRADLLLGADIGGGRGNAVLAAGYARRSALEVTQRAIAEIPISSISGYFSGSPATVPVLFSSPNTVQLGLGAGLGQGAIFDPATGALRVANQGDLFNAYAGTFFQTPLERYNVYAAAHYEVAPALDVYATGSFVRNNAALQLAATATGTSIYQLPLSNAYLPAGVRTQLCAANGIAAAACSAAAAATTPGSAGYREVPVIAQRRLAEFGPRGQSLESTQFQVQAGLRGDLGVSNIRYDVSAQYGETNQDQLRTNWGSFSRLQQSLRSYRNAAGGAVCSDVANGCVPFNLFAPQGGLSADMLGFIDLDPLIRRKVSLRVVTGSIGGDLFGLASPFAAKPVAFSLGAEYRRLRAQSRPDAPSQVQGEVLGTGARTPPDSGTISTREVFGELIAPLVSDRPFVRALQAEGGIRYSDYNTTGASLTWKAGGSWEVTRGIKFRGMYQVAVRSPNIQELFQSPVQGLGSLATDPCQAALPVGNAGLTALCIATGAPAGTIGAIPSPASSQINNTAAGNRTLDVERARTYTLGLVLTPPQVAGFSLTADYFHIEVRNAITQPSSGDVLNGCYSAALNPGYAYNAFCQLIGRNPLNGGLNGAAETPGVILSYSNLGRIATAGVDLGARYRFDLARLGLHGDPGALRFGFTGTWLDYYHSQANGNAINRDCTGYYSTNCTNPRPRYKWNGRVTYDHRLFDVSLLWTHVGKVRLEPYNAVAIQPLTTPQAGGPNPTATSFGTVILNGTTYTGVPANGILAPFRQIKAYDYFDLSSAIHVSRELELSLLVENLFARKPPLVGANVGGTAFNNGNTFPTVYDVLGRTFTVAGRLSF